MGKLRPIGQLVAEFLSGCWRKSPDPVHATAAEFKLAIPRLLDPQFASLAWYRIQNSELARLPGFAELQKTALKTVFQNAILRRSIEEMFVTLRSAGIEPILIKGWASARWYANPELRSYGDVDLLVPPAQLRAAKALFAGRKDIDLDHWEFSALPQEKLDEIWARSVLVPLNQSQVRVLGTEDHLSLLCRHFGRHLGNYPVGLCDISAVLESLPQAFDWNLCLALSGREAPWTCCTFRLAHEILGARCERQDQIPRWLVRAVTQQWNEEPVPIGSITRARSFVSALAERWPSPLKATLLLNGRLDNSPRLPYQLWWFLALAGKYAERALDRPAAHG